MGTDFSFFVGSCLDFSILICCVGFFAVWTFVTGFVGVLVRECSSNYFTICTWYSDFIYYFHCRFTLGNSL